MNPWAALIKIRFIKKIKTKSWEENVLECLEMVRERETVEVDGQNTLYASTKLPENT